MIYNNSLKIKFKIYYSGMKKKTAYYLLFKQKNNCKKCGS